MVNGRDAVAPLPPIPNPHVSAYPLSPTPYPLLGQPLLLSLPHAFPGVGGTSAGSFTLPASKSFEPIANWKL
ncbi:hypothetical protein EMGBS8_12530 [Verrucomicrobiota bacterium]|nr:hypothetical protein EMGBS8_12530 [Verrucomicrobiota bacterium]